MDRIDVDQVRRRLRSTDPVKEEFPEEIPLALCGRSKIRRRVKLNFTQVPAMFA